MQILFFIVHRMVKPFNYRKILNENCTMTIKLVYSHPVSSFVLVFLSMLTTTMARTNRIRIRIQIQCMDGKKKKKRNHLLSGRYHPIDGHLQLLIVVQRAIKVHRYSILMTILSLNLFKFQINVYPLIKRQLKILNRNPMIQHLSRVLVSVGCLIHLRRWKMK